MGRGSAVARCGECVGCTRTENCGDCSVCRKGQTPCTRKRCKVQEKAAVERTLAKRRLLKQQNQLETSSLLTSLVARHAPAAIAPVTDASPSPTVGQEEKDKSPGSRENIFKGKRIGVIKLKAPGRAPLVPRCGGCTGCQLEETKSNCEKCNSCKTTGKCPLRRCKAQQKAVNEAYAKKKQQASSSPGSVLSQVQSPALRPAHSPALAPAPIPVPTAPLEAGSSVACGQCPGCPECRCGDCPDCQQELPRCLAPAPHQVPLDFIHQAKVSPAKTNKPKMKKLRCGDCIGCRAKACGQCNVCQKTPHLCRDKWCKQPILQEVVKKEPKPKLERAQRVKVKKKKEDKDWSKMVKNQRRANPTRYKNCGDCNGCHAPDCGNCASCKMNEKFEGHENVLDKAKCLGKVCENPESLFNTKFSATDSGGSKIMVDQEDGTCPIREIRGVPYDFRCYFCKILPRVGMANRSELYRHYSVMHYAFEIKQEFGHISKCPQCHRDCKKGNVISHMGQTHNEVEKYLPERARIPLSIQGKAGRRRRGVVVYNRKNPYGWVFPEVPEGFNPRGDVRGIVEEEEPAPEPLVVDGFVIANERDSEDDEPLFLSRGNDKFSMPDYSGRSAHCTVCRSVFADISEAVMHIHDIHNIKGGSMLFMLDADRLLKAGYLNIAFNNEETKISQLGKEMEELNLKNRERKKLQLECDNITDERGATGVEESPRKNLISLLQQQEAEHTAKEGDNDVQPGSLVFSTLS